MKWSLVLGSLTIAAALMGCGSAIDPTAKADLDARIAGLRMSSTAIAAPAAGTPARMPLAAGQWVQYRMKLRNGQPKLLTEKVLSQQGDAFRYEMVHDTYQGRSIEQFLVASEEHGRRLHVELLALRTKDAHGHVIELSAKVLSMHVVTFDTYREKMASLVLPWRSEPQETTAVPAGHFEGCYRGHSEIGRGPRKWIEDIWVHSSVPLSGVVRVNTNRGFVSELVGYGTTGARSDF
jgi:hypothetical protein